MEPFTNPKLQDVPKASRANVNCWRILEGHELTWRFMGSSNF